MPLKKEVWATALFVWSNKGTGTLFDVWGEESRRTVPLVFKKWR